MTDLIKRDLLKEMDIDAILDLDASQIEDVAERAMFPTAQYQLLCTEAGVEAGTESSGAFIQVKFELVACVELANAEDADAEPEAGTMYQERYYRGFGMERFKTVYGDLLEELGEGATMRELLEAMPNTSWESYIEHKSRINKDTQEKREFNEMNTHLTSLIGETA